MFADPLSITFDDIYSTSEQRYLTIGQSINQKLLIISHTDDDHNHVVRIISARELTSHERQQYEKKR